MTKEIRTGERSASEVDHVVAPTDFSAAAEAGLAWAKALALRHRAELHLVHVVPPIPAPGDSIPAPPEAVEALSEIAQEKLESLAGSWREEGIEVTCHVSLGDASSGIVGVSERIEADVVVLSTRGVSGLQDLLLGSVARVVVRRARCPVLTVHPQHGEPQSAPRILLAPVDFSSHSEQALASALTILPPEPGARVILLHVWKLPAQLKVYGVTSATKLASRVDEIRAKLEERLEMVAGPLRRSGLEVETRLAEGHPSTVTVEMASSTGADLVVLGTQGLRGIERWLLGSVAERVIQRAPCPVLTARRMEED